MPSIQELLTSLGTAITQLQDKVTVLEAEKAALKAQLPPTGIVKIVITDVDMSKVTFS